MAEKKEKKYVSDNAQLMAEWDWEKNNELGFDPSRITCGSSKKVWWICNKEHKLEADVNSRNKGNGCPICAGKKVLIGFNDLSTTHPKIAKEWHPTKNSNLTPADVTAGSSKAVWWLCSNGHEWKSVINSRTHRNRGCPVCGLSSGARNSNNTRITQRGSLEQLRPDLASEWCYDRNTDLLPSDVTLGSDKKVWWICKNGHEWECAVRFRAKKNYGCPICSGKQVLPGYNDLETINPTLASEWHPTRNGLITPSMVLPGSNKKAWWICKNGHEWQAVINSRNQGRQCPICSEGRQTSFPEQAIYFYLKQSLSSTISRSDLFGFELDIYIPELNIGIEYDGQYYHSNVERDKEKDTLAALHNIILIRVREQGCPSYVGSSIHIIRENLSLQDLNRTIVEIFAFIKKRFTDIKMPSIDINRDYSAISSQIELIPIEKSIASLFPELIAEWDFYKNEKNLPENTSPGSTKLIWWKCSICGHEWQVSPNARTNASKSTIQGCPKCGKEKQLKSFRKNIVRNRGSLQSTNPELARQWNFNKNAPLLPSEFTAHSKKRVWWRCASGHEWVSSIDARSRGNGCPQCAKEKRKKKD